MDYSTATATARTGTPLTNSTVLPDLVPSSVTTKKRGFDDESTSDEDDIDSYLSSSNQHQPRPTILFNNNDLNSVKKLRMRSTINSSDSRTELLQRNSSRRTPSIVLKQAHFNKTNSYELFESVTNYNNNSNSQLCYIPSNSSMKTTIPLDVNFLSLQPKIPLVLFLFGTGCDDAKFLDGLNHMSHTLNHNSNKQTSFIGVSASFAPDYNHYNFPIIIDENGLIARLLGLLDPLGGGKYPIASVLVFDNCDEGVGLEVARVKLGYDFGNFYGGNNSANSLESVLTSVLEFIR